MKTRAKTSTVIHAGTAAVFKYLADTKLHFVWNPHMQEVKPLGRLHQGEIYESLNILLGVRVRNLNKVVKLVENQELQLKSQAGMLDYKIVYRLKALSPKETELTCTTNITVKTKAFYFAEPMIDHLARRELKTDLGLLKQAVEQKLT
jgi:hypothetical protein